MANTDHIRYLLRGTDVWNAWRTEHAGTQPNFSGADLRRVKLKYGANLTRSRFDEANMKGACFYGADFEEASFQNANLAKTDLRKCHFRNATLWRANLTKANLQRAHLCFADLREANLSGANLKVFDCSDAKIHGAIIKDVLYETSQIVALYSRTTAWALLEMDGWDRVSAETVPFLNKYIEDCFSHVKDAGEPIIDASGEKRYTERQYNLELLGLIRPLYNSPIVDDTCATVITELNKELISYLARNPKRMLALGDRDFEKLVAELLFGFGWKVELTRRTKDGGYDIFGITTDRSGVRQTWIVECKRWRNSVGIEIARQLYTVKNELRVGGAMLATTSNFTRGVQEFKASRYDFDLRDFEAISTWLREHSKHGL